MHCPPPPKKKYLIHRIETEPVTIGSDATIFVIFLVKAFVNKTRTYRHSVASALIVTSSEILIIFGTVCEYLVSVKVSVKEMSPFSKPSLYMYRWGTFLF